VGIAVVADSTAGANKIAILDGLLAVLKEISIFENQVFKGYRTRSDAAQDILVHFYEDVPVVEAVDEDEHNIHFHVMVRMKTNLPADDPESEIDAFIDLVGLVEDKIKDNHCKAGSWEDIGITRITYTFGQDRTFLFYKAMIRLVARAQW